MRTDDPDRPFPYETYVAIASYVRHHGRCQVHVTALPYGMWWRELRADVDLIVAPLEDPARARAQDPAGIWEGPNEWIAVDDDRYATAAAPYRAAVTWLDDQDQQEQPERA